MCGVAGIVGKCTNPYIMSNYIGLMSDKQQTRGQDGAGLGVVYKGELLAPLKESGQVVQIFTEAAIKSNPSDFGAIGHVQYKTKGGLGKVNAHPFRKTGRYDILLCHNGQVEDTDLRRLIEEAGGVLEGTSDSEAIAYMIANSQAPTIEDAIAEICSNLTGAYSLLVLTNDKLIAVRDPYGIRPLSFAKVVNCDGRFHLVASETCSFTFLGDQNSQEVQPGTMVIFDQEGWRVRRFAEGNLRLCIFELFYLLRPDSVVHGITVRALRRALGTELARYCQELDLDKGVDIVFGTPESGVPGAEGYHQASGISYDPGLIANRNARRGFMVPDSKFRQSGVPVKLSVIKSVVDGKKIILTDDTVVRGDTSRQACLYLKHVGNASEVHMRILSPPIKHPCYYGIDMATYDELIASKVSKEKIAEDIKAESCVYLPFERTLDVIERFGLPRYNLCHHCISGCKPNL